MIQTKPKNRKPGNPRDPDDPAVAERTFFRGLVDVLKRGGVEDAPLEASAILERVTDGRGRFARDSELSPVQEAWASALAASRACGVPLAYVLGSREFMSIDFAVDERVLVPRPESETLVETAERQGRTLGKDLTFIDIGAGSGNIAVSLLARNPEWRAIAVDISEDACAVARTNARTHGVLDRCRLLCGDMLTALCTSCEADMIISNPPYVSEGEFAGLPREVRDHEPAVALYGGADGLDFYRALADAVPGRLKQGGIIEMEVGCGRAEPVARILEREGIRVTEIVKDMAGIDRVVVGRS